jgi:hypothetical protein
MRQASTKTLVQINDKRAAIAAQAEIRPLKNASGLSTGFPPAR